MDITPPGGDHTTDPRTETDDTARPQQDTDLGRDYYYTLELDR